MKKSNYIKHHFKKSNHYAVMSQKELAGKTEIRVIRDLLTFFGIGVVVVMIVSGPILSAELVTSIGMTLGSNTDSTSLRELGTNATKDCTDGFQTNSYCYAFNLYNVFNDTRYVPANKYDMLQSPLNTYLYGGDCKNMAMLYTATMKNLGFEALVRCRVSEQHCINIVPFYNNYERQSGFAVVDLTMPGFFLMESGMNAWNYKTEGVKYD